MGSNKHRDDHEYCISCDCVIEFCKCVKPKKKSRSKYIEQKASQSQGDIEQQFGDQAQAQSQGDQKQQQAQGFGDQDLDQTQGDQQQQQSQGFGDQDLDQTQGDQQQQQSQGFGDQDLDQTQGDQQQQQSQGFGDQDLDQTQGDQQQQQSQGFGDQDLDQTQGDQQQQQSQGFGDQDLDQTQGDQQQQQSQGFGDQDLDQTQGDQQQQQAQAHGDQQQDLGEQSQTQDHGDQTQMLGDQMQEQGHDQQQAQGEQTQSQEHGDQMNGDQTNEGHTNTSPLDNSQSISTPVDVDGVTVNVKCGDSIQIPYPYFQPKCPHCDRYEQDDWCGKKSCKKKDRCKKGCADCVDCFCELAEAVKNEQATITSAEDKQIDLYFSVPSTLTNPAINQVITDVNACSILKFKEADQATVIPSTTVQLCDVAGIRATDSGNTPNMFTFLLQRSREEFDSCKQKCDCTGCADGIGGELEATEKFGIGITLNIKGVTTVLPTLFVLSVKDCLVYLADDLVEPEEIYVFTLCSVTGFSVESQTI